MKRPPLTTFNKVMLTLMFIGAVLGCLAAESFAWAMAQLVVVVVFAILLGFVRW